VNLFDALGFCWDRDAIPQQTPTYSKERVCFRLHRMLPEFVWDASVLEGNPITYPEVKTLLDGVTIGGRKLSDQEQVLNLANGARRLLEWGHFRGEGQETGYTPDVGLGEAGRYSPLPTLQCAPELNRVFAAGITALNEVPSVLERGLAFFLFGALQQFFFDGNKRTSRFMMNGILMSAGIDAISVPAAGAQDFNEKNAAFLSVPGRY
jgi:hypothetical protein